ncbi:MAG: S-layer homology domain-containing protein [Oscillibacter sp.]|nr:S-layer homology domain-containing protein [Oscillibacter sp.]
MKKRILTWLLALTMAVSALAAPAFAAEQSRFSDVSDPDTLLAIETLRLMGALDGYPDGTFQPKGYLTRAQFCKMVIYAMNGADELSRYETITVFPDVRGSHWASSYVNMAAKGKGVIAGYPDGAFHPEETVTAGQAVTILLRILGYADADIGGIWPASYMAMGEKIGLLKGLDTTGTAPLSRGEAARLFLNLLQSERKDGGSYLASIGNAISDVVLVSCAAVGPDGLPTAMELSGGEVYAMAGKAGNGLLNGHRGTLLLNDRGRAVTFVPSDVGSGSAVTIASASATKITTTSGARYTVARNAQAYYGGEQRSWNETYAWLTAGTEATVYVGGSGSVEYVFVAGSGAESALVVEENGSTAGFTALAGSNSYALTKNGAKATTKDIRKGDVATYSAATNTIRLCDTRITVYYEDCTPSPREPMEITVLGGVKLQVLESAMSDMAKHKPGSIVTLLLTDDGQVAGTASGKESALGMVADGQVWLFCGGGRIGLGSVSGSGEYEGQMVTIQSDKSGVKLHTPKDGVSGVLKVTERKLGNLELADHVMIYEGTSAVALSDLISDEIPKSQIAYARKNWAGEVDLIQIGDSKGGVVYYGRATVTKQTAFDEDLGAVDTTMMEVVYGKDGQVTTTGAYETGYSVQNGDYVAATLRGDRFVRVTQMDEVRNVSNSAWNGPYSVTVKGKLYAVSEDVLCYNRSTGRWMTLSEGHAYAEECTLYVLDGIVRIVEVKN